MPSKKGGYKLVSLGGLDLTGENLSLKGLYNALKLSYGKVILLCGIIINSVVKKDAFVQAEEEDEVINIKHVYGYNLSVDSDDSITVEVDSEGIELPVPTAEDDGKIVGVNVLGKYVLKPAPDTAKLYVHKLHIKLNPSSSNLDGYLSFISSDNTPLTAIPSSADLKNSIKVFYGDYVIIGDGYPSGSRVLYYMDGKGTIANTAQFTFVEDLVS